MRVVVKNNQVRYKYAKEKLAYNDKMSIITYSIAIVVFIFALCISIIYGGEGPLIVGALGTVSIVFDLVSMFFSIYEIYEYNIYKRVTRNMLILQICFLIFLIIL